MSMDKIRVAVDSHVHTVSNAVGWASARSEAHETAQDLARVVGSGKNLERC